MDSLKLSIFEDNAVRNGERIFVNGIREEIREICRELGGVTAVSRLLNLKHSHVREWPYRGKPISLRTLVQLLNFLPEEKRTEYRTKIESKDLLLSARYSSLMVKFPR